MLIYNTTYHVGRTGEILPHLDAGEFYLPEVEARCAVYSRALHAY